MEEEGEEEVVVLFERVVDVDRRTFEVGLFCLDARLGLKGAF